jgi:hypothetical protein
MLDRFLDLTVVATKFLIDLWWIRNQNRRGNGDLVP